MDREGGRERRRGGERGEENRTNFLILEEFVLPLSSSPPLLLSDVILCALTGPSWAEDLRWKTSEFLDVFKGTRGLKSSLHVKVVSVLCWTLNLMLTNLLSVHCQRSSSRI